MAFHGRGDRGDAFVAMAMAAGAAWSHGSLALQCLQEHKS